MDLNGEEEGQLVPIAPQELTQRATTPPLVEDPEDTVYHYTPAAEGSAPQVHLHHHQHLPGGPTVDREAREVVDRLAAQHGELFRYLNSELQGLRAEGAHEREMLRQEAQ